MTRHTPFHLIPPSILGKLTGETVPVTPYNTRWKQQLLSAGDDIGFPVFGSLHAPRVLVSWYG